MKKKNNKGFMLAETLIVTVFVAGVLIFLYIQFSNLSSSYDDSFNYNTVEGLYALEDIKTYIESDDSITQYINTNIDTLNYIDITNCDLFSDREYCSKLFELENINRIIITKNKVNVEEIKIKDEGLNNFIKKINEIDYQKYRLIASFNNSTYATVRFGDVNEK